jgi:hypothetical protein
MLLQPFQSVLGVFVEVLLLPLSNVLVEIAVEHKNGGTPFIPLLKVSIAVGQPIATSHRF